MMTNNSIPICAVIVTYYPHIQALQNLIKIVIGQSCAVVIVDNGSCCEIVECINNIVEKTANCSLLELEDNIGIAAAQNIGINWARDHSFKYVVFFDQDSTPADNLVQSLLSVLTTLNSTNFPLAAVGPQLIDKRTGRKRPFGRWTWLFKLKKMQLLSQNLRFTDFLVSSGMLVPIEIFDIVGLLDEGLFIDNVDLEWSFRARSMGYHLIGVCNTIMEHSIGDMVYSIGQNELYCHKPIRQYYIMRNRILLYQRDYAPIGWVLEDIFRMLFKVFMFSIVFSPRRQNIHMMWRGLKDACIGRVGKYMEEQG